MALGISQFKGKFEGGARSNLFKVKIGTPTGVTIEGEQLEFLVKSTTLPASTVEVLNVPFRGRDLKIAGKRSFEPWSVTVINDQNFDLRTAFETWSANMSYHDVNSSKYDLNNDSYLQDAQVYQLAHKGGDHVNAYSYTFVGLWPSSIAAIPLESEGENIEEFAVEFQYQYWFSNKGAAEINSKTGGLIGSSGSAGS